MVSRAVRRAWHALCVLLIAGRSAGREVDREGHALCVLLIVLRERL